MPLRRPEAAAATARAGFHTAAAAACRHCDVAVACGASPSPSRALLAAAHGVRDCKRRDGRAHGHALAAAGTLASAARFPALPLHHRDGWQRCGAKCALTPRSRGSAPPPRRAAHAVAGPPRARPLPVADGIVGWSADGMSFVIRSEWWACAAVLRSGAAGGERRATRADALCRPHALAARARDVAPGPTPRRRRPQRAGDSREHKSVHALCRAPGLTLMMKEEPSSDHATCSPLPRSHRADVHRFSTEILPQFFRTSNFSSFRCAIAVTLLPSRAAPFVARMCGDEHRRCPRPFVAAASSTFTPSRKSSTTTTTMTAASVARAAV